MSFITAGSLGLFNNPLIDSAQRMAAIADTLDTSHLVKPINIAETFSTKQFDGLLTSLRAINENFFLSDLNEGLAGLARAIDQQWAKPLSDLGRQANLISKSMTVDMNVAAEALAKAAVVLDTKPKSHITLPRVDAVNYYPVAITQKRRRLWSDELFEEDDPPSYFGENLDANLLKALDEPFFRMSANEFRESFRDLQRKPHPDLTGAISHANAGFLSVARVIDGNSNANPRKIVARHANLLPKPLDEAVLKHWGFPPNMAARSAKVRLLNITRLKRQFMVSR